MCLRIFCSEQRSNTGSAGKMLSQAVLNDMSGPARVFHGIMRHLDALCLFTISRQTLVLCAAARLDDERQCSDVERSEKG